ncbi:MAG: DUF3142 domain-containing protein [Myxococcales bacterium]
MTIYRLPGGALLGAALLLACRPDAMPRAPLTHEAYVWQRLWTPEVSAAVREAPPELAALHVLARERSGAGRSPTDVPVDLEALKAANRELVAVMRVGGTAPLEDVGLGELAAIARGWRAAGLRVRALEVDHDCATEKLPGYADWLAREKARVPDFRVGITALPTWAAANDDVSRLASVADEVVLQVHAVKAPSLFEVESALRWAEAWSKATGQPFRLALPTYRVKLRDGKTLESDPVKVASLLASLSSRPAANVAGVAWFRLGNPGDATSWSAKTLTAVLRGEALTPRVETRLLESAPGAVDLEIVNVGTVDARGPQRIALEGSVDLVEGVRGCRGRENALECTVPELLRAGEAVVVGFARGKEIRLADAH